MGIRVRGRREILRDKDEGQNGEFSCVFFKTKSNISGRGLGEFQKEMERGGGLGGEGRTGE